MFCCGTKTLEDSRDVSRWKFWMYKFILDFGWFIIKNAAVIHKSVCVCVFPLTWSLWCTAESCHLMFNDHLMTSLLLSADGGNKHKHIKQEHWVYRIWRNTKSLVYIYRVTSSSHTVWAAISSGPWDAEQSRYLDVVTPCSDLDSSQHFYFVVLQLHFHFSLESPLQHLHLSSWTEGWERERQLQNKDWLSKSNYLIFPRLN